MKIYLRTSNLKTYLKIVRTDQGILGALPGKMLSAAIYQNDEAELDEDQMMLLKETLFKFAQEKLLNYLASAEKTVYDCRIYLKKWYVSEDNINNLIETAILKKFLSDERYARMMIEDAILFHKSPEEIKIKLKQKKISSTLYQPLLKELYTQDSMTETLSALIDSLLTRYYELTEKQKYDKIATFLYRKGYKYDQFRRILLDKLCECENEE